MEFKGIEHYDVFDDDVIIFWADIAGLPEEIQAIAREIDGCGFDPDRFGVCVNYSFAEKKFYLVTDMGESEDDLRNIFYIEQDGDKHWLKTDIPPELWDRVVKECGRVVSEGGFELPRAATEPEVDEAKLRERLAQYMELDLFQMDIGELIRNYQSQGLPVPPMEQLREEAAAEARRCLEIMMICEAKGHLWEEKADPENGISTLSCRRCGAQEHLQW